MNYIGRPSIPTASIEEKRRPSLASKNTVTARASETQEGYGLPSIADNQEREGLPAILRWQEKPQDPYTNDPSCLTDFLAFPATAAWFVGLKGLGANLLHGRARCSHTREVPASLHPSASTLLFCFRHKLDTNLYKLVPGLLIRLRYQTMAPSTASTHRDIGPEVDLIPSSEPENGPDSEATAYTVHSRPIMSSETRKKFINYPLPIPGPPIPYKNVRKSNPPLRGWLLVLAAWAMECLWFIRSFIWSNAGFGSLRKIRKHIEDAEPRYDPTVLPLPADEAKDPAVLHRESAVKAKPHPLKYYSVNDYHEMYLSGVVTPLAAARAILPLIRRDTNPPGEHSIAWFDTKVSQVLAAAEASTKRYKEGRSLGPLDGVPTAVKDEYEIDGYRTCLGSRNDYTTPAAPGQSITSWCVKKLEDAGAVVLGKLSMHEFGLDTTGNNPIYGTPRNPYNRGYYTGGSSSGAGYAVATGLVPVALGSDGGGSIRIPSSMCGVYGLKPTHGRISFHPCPNHSNSCAVNGPIAADIESLATYFETIGAPHPDSQFIQASPFILSPSEKRGKVLGIPEAWFAQADPAIQRMCRTMIAKLVTHHGYVTVPIDIPFLVEGQFAHAMTVLTDGATLLPETKNLTPANRILLAIGRVTSAMDYLLAQKLRGLLMQHLAHLWCMYPGMIIVTPTTSCAGWPIMHEGELTHGVSDGDRTIRSMEYVWMGNFCGLPGVTVPAGYVVPHDQLGAGGEAGPDTVGKVPIGLMGMGEWTDEHSLLEFGLDAEELFAKERCRPPNWIDVIQRAKDDMAKNGEDSLIDL